MSVLSCSRRWRRDMRVRLAVIAAFSLFLSGSLIADCTSQPWTFATAYVTTTCGSVGIGVTNPLNALHVGGGTAGTARFEGDIFLGTNGVTPKLWLWSGTSGTWMQGDGTGIYFGGQGGTFSFSNADM